MTRIGGVIGPSRILPTPQSMWQQSKREDIARVLSEWTEYLQVQRPRIKKMLAKLHKLEKEGGN